MVAKVEVDGGCKWVVAQVLVCFSMLQTKAWELLKAPGRLKQPPRSKGAPAPCPLA